MMAAAAAASTSREPPPSPTLSQLPPIPGSPTYSMASTANPLSQYNLPLPPPPPPRALPAVLSAADLEQSQLAYADLLAGAKAYRVALAALSTASSAFGAALEACARLKEARAEAIGPLHAASDKGGPGPPLGADGYPPRYKNSNNSSGGGGGGSSRPAPLPTGCTADPLLAAAGVQHLVANHVQILGEAVYRAFEVPLLHELDKWRAAVDDEADVYARAARARAAEIRRLEKEGVRLHRQRGRRDVARFRDHLVQLTAQLDGLTLLHGEHARAVLAEGQDVSVRIVDAGCSLVRAEVDIFESLARKGWSGGGLEDLLERGADLFAADEAAVATAESGRSGGGAESKLFSILPPGRSILADSASDTTARPGHIRADSLLIDDPDRYQSLAGAIGDAPGGGGRDSDSVFSEFNRSRGVVRPFSPPPQPVRLNPDGLIVDSLEERAEAAAAAERHGRGPPDAEPDNKRLRQPDPEDDLATPLGDVTALLDEDRDMEAHQPWRDSGLPHSLTLGRASTASTTSLTSSQLRERRWSVNERERHAEPVAEDEGVE